MSRPILKLLIYLKGDVCADVPPGLIGSVDPMLWTSELKPCVSAVKFNAERAADDFLLNAHATIVYIYIYIYTIIGRSLVNICKGLEPRKCRSMNARSRPFFAKPRSLNDNMGQLCIGLGTLNIYQCSPRKPNNFIQTGQ